MPVPYKKTVDIQGFIGQDRPIYGNEVLPPSPTPTISVTPSPTPVYYYYELQDCNGPGYGFIRTESTFLSGHIGKSIYTLERGCMEVFATATTETDLLTWAPPYALHADCSACATQYTPTPTPTPPITPTISLTPSITPTVSPSFDCTCLSYTLTNTGIEAQITYSYWSCYNTFVQGTLNPSEGISFCACNGTVSVSGSFDLQMLGGCNPVTPTPSITATNSPTPTPSGYPYVYEVSNCDDATEIRTFGSSTFIALGKVVRASLIDGCFEVVGPSSNPIEDYVINTYLSCGSCPR